MKEHPPSEQRVGVHSLTLLLALTVVLDDGGV
jgi:hypothetical protein